MRKIDLFSVLNNCSIVGWYYFDDEIISQNSLNDENFYITDFLFFTFCRDILKKMYGLKYE